MMALYVLAAIPGQDRLDTKFGFVDWQDKYPQFESDFDQQLTLVASAIRSNRADQEELKLLNNWKKKYEMVT